MRTRNWLPCAAALTGTTAKSAKLVVCIRVRPSDYDHGAEELKRSFSTFAFTAPSILISSGQGSLKPSPSSYVGCVESSLVPLAISQLN